MLPGTCWGQDFHASWCKHLLGNKKPMALTTVYLLDYHAISLVFFAAVVWSCHAARSLSQENRWNDKESKYW